jgi:putative hydrolase of the HAD superfamily
MLVVLDLDDTLYLERNYVISGFRAVDRWIYDNLNVSGFFEQAWNSFENGTRGHIFDEALKALLIFKKEIVKQIVQVYRSHTPDISIEKDAFDFFDNHDPINLAIITDGYEQSQWNKIQSLGLEKYFSKIVVTDSWGRRFWKPHPKAFQYVQDGFSPENCVYIADNPQKDFNAPAELGWAPSIRIRRIGSLHYDIETPQSCLEIESFTQLPF